jgi:hypothetical protein
MEENARRQQEEMRRLNTPPAPNHSTTPSPGYGASPQPGSRQQSSGSTASNSNTEIKSGPAPKAPPPAKPWVRVLSTPGSDYYLESNPHSTIRRAASTDIPAQLQGVTSGTQDRQA